MLNELIAQLKSGVDLDGDHTRAAVEQLAAEAVPAKTKANFLTALSEKGESTRELAAFATELRHRATPVPVDDATRDRGMLDVCGTGGDGLNTFNISTTSAIVAAATLSFLGLGVQPPTPDWGFDLADGRRFVRHAPWLTLAPIIAISITVLAINFLGDGLRDALDPRYRSKSK